MKPENKKIEIYKNLLLNIPGLKQADYIKTVKHYVEYGMEEGAYDQVLPQMSPEMPEMGPEMVDFEYDPAEFDEYDDEN